LRRRERQVKAAGNYKLKAVFLHLVSLMNTDSRFQCRQVFALYPLGLSQHLSPPILARQLVALNDQLESLHGHKSGSGNETFPALKSHALYFLYEFENRSLVLIVWMIVHNLEGVEFVEAMVVFVDRHRVEQKYVWHANLIRHKRRINHHRPT
jgi:hypothetical protein